MIVCRTCGGHNADTADFCGSCGEFLEWTGEKLAPQVGQPAVAEPEPVAPQPKPVAPQPKPVEPQPAVTGFTPAVSGFTPAVAGYAPAVTPSKPAVTSVKPVITEPPQHAAEALVAPLPPVTSPTSPTPAAVPGPVARKPQPPEMHPQAPVRRRPTAPTTPSPPTRQLQPDDLICGACGEGNLATRRFCSRCGDSLQTAAVVPTPPVPWWRRFLGLFERKVHPAGARPKRRSRLLTLRGLTMTLRRTLLVALLLAGLLYAVVPSMRSLVNGLVIGGKDRLEALFARKDVPVRPISTTATAELADHNASQVTDLRTNTFWAAADAAEKPTLVVVFDHPTQLTRAIVHNGDGAGDFPARGRPQELHLVYFDGSGTVLGAADVTLKDTPDGQEVRFGGGDGATRVEISVSSVHPAPQDPGFALSEIEFFERQ